ncbi:MAG: Ig-like domain-containing protein [Myxococcota bacterium]
MKHPRKRGRVDLLQITLALLLAWGCAACADSGAGGDGEVATGADADAEVAAEVVADVPVGPAGTPSVTVLSPEADSVWKLGESIPVSVRISDSDDPVSSLTYALRAAGVGVVAEGAVASATLDIAVDSLSAGSHVLTLEVRDPAGHVGQASVAVRVNRPPAGATVVSIAPAAPTTADALLATVQTAAVDPDGQVVTYRFAWSRDGEAAQIAQAQVPSTATARGQTWTVRAFPSDGDHEGEVGTASVVIANAPPTLKSVSLLPSAATTDATLTCSAAGWADADGDAEGYRFEWYVDGKLVVGQSGETLDGAWFDKGQSVRCRVAPWDGLDAGKSLDSAVVPVLDTPPGATGVEISPAAGTSKTTFTCAATDLSDPDPGDTPTVQTIWLVDGVEQPGTTSASYTPVGQKRGAKIQCKVVPSSGAVTGSPLVSATVVLGNAAPSVGAVIVTPVPATESTGVQCVASDLTDADGDAVTLRVTWKVDGAVVDGESGAILSGAHYKKGQTVSCSVVPFDGVDAGASVASKFGTVIANEAPTLETVSLGPPGATGSDTLVCTPSGFADPDGDAAGFQYAWTIDGAAVAGADKATLSGNGLSKGDEVVCVVTPFDGEAAGPPVSSLTLTVANSAPSLASASVTPLEGGKLSVFTCVPAGHSDPDAGDLKVYGFRWFVDGVVVAGQTGASFVPGIGAASGAEIRCEATPSDGLASGAPVLSGPAVLKNQAPTVASVSVGPAGADVTTTLACVAIGLADADGDPVTVGYQWTVNDALVTGESGATLAGGVAKKGQTVRCLAVPSDTKVSGAPVQSQPLVIGNAPPKLAGAAVTPSAGTTATTFTCSAQGASDPDDDAVSVGWRWLINGVAVPGAVDVTYLPGAAASGGDLLRCEATPSDGAATGAAVTSAAVTLEGPPPDNQPPTVTSANITPATAVTTSVLTCNGVGAADPEGKTVTLNYAWTKGGVPIGGQTAKTLPAAAHKKGDSIACSVTPYDGELFGSAATSAPVVIGNSAPVIADVVVTPLQPAAGAALTCTVTASDPDDDAISYAYQWLLESEIAAGQTAATLAAGTTQACEQWTCLARVSDGQLFSGFDEDSVATPSGGVTGAFGWFKHHSFDPTTGTTPKSLSAFLKIEVAATRITLPASAFPYTLTKVRFVSAGQTYTVKVYNDAFGKVGTELGSQQVVGNGTYQEVTLTTPVEFATQQSFWLGLGSPNDGMTIRGDGSPPADATANEIYGCSFFLGGTCFTVFEWKPFDSFADPFGTPSTDPFVTFGDLIIDAGGVTGAGCP